MNVLACVPEKGRSGASFRHPCILTWRLLSPSFSFALCPLLGLSYLMFEEDSIGYTQLVATLIPASNTKKKEDLSLCFSKCKFQGMIGPAWVLVPPALGHGKKGNRIDLLQKNHIKWIVKEEQFLKGRAGFYYGKKGKGDTTQTKHKKQMPSVLIWFLLFDFKQVLYHLSITFLNSFWNILIFVYLFSIFISCIDSCAMRSSMCWGDSGEQVTLYSCPWMIFPFICKYLPVSYRAISKQHQ